MAALTTHQQAAARAARDVPINPRELCTTFTPNRPPAKFWCATCGWNEPMHDGDIYRTAVAAELQRLSAARTAPDAP